MAGTSTIHIYEVIFTVRAMLTPEPCSGSVLSKTAHVVALIVRLFCS